MIKERYMVWPIKAGTEDITSELEDELRGFETYERAEAFAQRYSNRTGKSTAIEFQTYEITRRGYDLLESDFGPWGTKPKDKR